jgi:hypothetical protein
MPFGRSAIESNVVAVFMLQQRTRKRLSMSLCNVRDYSPRVPPVPAEGETSHVAVDCGPGALSVARGCQLAPSRPAVSFGPLLHGETLRGHDRNPVPQDSARRKLQPFMRGRRIAEADNIGKRVAGIGAASRGAGALDYFGGEIASLRFR